MIEEKRCKEAAQQALTNAYAPYSRFRVAAVLLGDNGEIYAGVNVENASFGLTICAERSALFAAVTAGERTFRWALILTEAPDPTPPCGACRQVLREFGVPRVISLAGESRAEWEMDYLLPEAFVDFPRST